MVSGEHGSGQSLWLHARRQGVMAALPHPVQPQLRVWLPDGRGGKLCLSVPRPLSGKLALDWITLDWIRLD